MFSEVAEITLVAPRLGQFQQLLKTRVILILSFTRPHAITYTNLSVSQGVFLDNLKIVKFVRVFKQVLVLHVIAIDQYMYIFFFEQNTVNFQK